MRDLVSGAAVTKTGLAASSAVTISGGQLLPLFGTSNYADLQQPARITSGTQPVTIAWAQEPRSPSAYNALLNWKISGAANSFAIYQATADAAYYFAIGPRSGGSVQLLYGAVGATTSGAQDLFLLVCRGGLNSTTASDYTLYRNGVVIASSGTTNFGANSASVFRVGALDSGGDPFEGAVGDFHVWSRGLNDAEARSWTQNRFQTLKPAANRSVFLATAGGAPTLSVADGTHAHAADSLTLTSSTALAINDATHAHASDSIGLTTQTGITVADASHAHAADGLTLSTAAVLSVADAGHGHTADSLTLSSAAFLAVFDALHAHAADGLALTSDAWLTVADAAHAHSADNLDFSGALTLAIADALHLHSAESLSLTVSTHLAVADGAHAHGADSLTLTLGSGDVDELYPLAGQAQTYPMTGATSYPLAGQSQTYPLGN